MTPLRSCVAAALLLLALGRPLAGQTPRKSPAAPAPPASKSPAPARPAARPAAVSWTPVALGPVLKELGYAPAPHGEYQRLKVEEERYGYFVDVSLSRSGEWLVCMAHLAPIADLTKVAPTPLLGLLAANDSLLGMAFSYDRVNGRVMLNCSVPTRGLEPAALKSTLERLKETVRQTEGTWDSSTWN